MKRAARRLAGTEFLNCACIARDFSREAKLDLTDPFKGDEFYQSMTHHRLQKEDAFLKNVIHFPPMSSQRSMWLLVVNLSLGANFKLLSCCITVTST